MRTGSGRRRAGSSACDQPGYPQGAGVSTELDQRGRGPLQHRALCRFSRRCSQPATSHPPHSRKNRQRAETVEDHVGATRVYAGQGGKAWPVSVE